MRIDEPHPEFLPHRLFCLLRARMFRRWLGHAMRRFDARVLQLMASNPGVPLALANLAAREQISAAHIHITRHLGLQGSRLTELAEAAGMKSSMTIRLSLRVKQSFSRLLTVENQEPGRESRSNSPKWQRARAARVAQTR